jgi:hypothetical protein
MNPSEKRVLGAPLSLLAENRAFKPRTAVTIRADRPAHKPLKARIVKMDIATGTKIEKFSPRNSMNGRTNLFSLPRPETNEKYF